MHAASKYQEPLLDTKYVCLKVYVGFAVVQVIGKFMVNKICNGIFVRKQALVKSVVNRIYGIYVTMLFY